ncbi:MAG: hypothetical protein IKO36_04755 [Bacteroidaceae bacterium]|nr:hypothetical protein [Bacteroidaceae bacterium]
MYKRFLQDSDYLSVITKEALGQLIRDEHGRFEQAEQAAEATICDYLIENYKIEEEFMIGKRIQPYDSRITYPVNSGFWRENNIYIVIKSIKGYKCPEDASEYWVENVDVEVDVKTTPRFLQIQNYYPGDNVAYNGVVYTCIKECGVDFKHIIIPGITAWKEVKAKVWEKKPYELWDVVKYDGQFYTLLTVSEEHEDFDSPDISDDWGLIGEYDPDYAQYELNGHDYVVYNDKVFYPVLNPNPDSPEVGVNIKAGDPRNFNLKRHMVQLALYELHKLVAPHNVSNIRISDYEHSMEWLQAAGRLKINPQIPRRLDERKQPISDWAVATFMRDYDPMKNPWQI